MSRRRHRKSRRPDRDPKVRVSWVRFPIQIPTGLLLLVLIYARYSSDEQRPRSIDAQVQFCKKFLEDLGVTNAEIVVISDEAMSGELRSRPGIDRVWEGIRARTWRLMLAEDSSRLYRDEVACLDLVRLAVDKDVRTICVNDFVDTCDPDWEERLKDAARHHASSNRYNSERIKRALEELWDIGAAIGPLKPGYRRVPSIPATETEPAEGPFFDEVAPRWSPTVLDAFERIAVLEAPWAVADRLTAAGIPRTNGREGPWTEDDVIAMIRWTIYRGFESYRDSISKKEYSTGRRKQIPNDPEDILTREMPHLRITEDCLWTAANKALDNRNRCQTHHTGADHPQYGIPRDSRGPLSGVFFCSRCPNGSPAKMHVDGRIEGGYRCGNIRNGECWNKTTALQDFTHDVLGEAIIRQLKELDGEIDLLLDHLRRLMDDHGKREARRASLLARKTGLELALRKLAYAFEKGDERLNFLVRRGKEREDELAVVEAELDALDQLVTRFLPPTRKDIQGRIEELVPRLEQMDRTVRDDLEQLVGRIYAIPHQQFDTNKVVLRARFQIHLAALLPARTRAALAGLLDGPINQHFDSIPMMVDLFEPSAGPKYGLKALELKEQRGWGPTRIAKELSITKRQVCIAQKYGLSLRAAGLTDPYIELTEPPEAASRWRTHPRHQKKRDADGD